MAPKSKDKPRKPKKPYHIKREDLHLEEYIEERDSKDPRIFFSRLGRHFYHSTQLRIYIALQVIAVYIGFGQLMLIIGLFWAMLANTTKRKEGEMSAYSLFNEGVEA
ncbi:hypothetical protein BU16DRAFT_336404 [Lophium mytilinum]|uniref:SAYSvFN domain-containing protein n=1 Tax=Lophium mytilinum TaxID=390894 RepID=A0A6A6QWP8_9PEZI|nr:hypothetical protein BU16DRAFT_336404 [Lophium mytilinum]